MNKTKESRGNAFDLYMKGVPLADISRQLSINPNTIRSWCKRGQWEQQRATEVAKLASTPHCASDPDPAPVAVEPAPIVEGETTRRRRRGGQPGNKNGLGNRGNPNASAPMGNSNGESDGFFRKYLPAECMEIVEDLNKKSPLDILWDNITIQYVCIIRAQKIMYVDGKGDKTVEKISYADGAKMTSESFEVQQAWDKHANFMTAQSRAIGTLTTLIKQYLELQGSTKADAKAAASDWKQAVIDIAKKRKAVLPDE